MTNVVSVISMSIPTSLLFPPVLGIQSPDQMELLAKHNPNRPVFVEGPFPLWLRKICVYYYILRADPLPPEEKVGDPVQLC